MKVLRSILVMGCMAWVGSASYRADSHANSQSLLFNGPDLNAVQFNSPNLAQVRADRIVITTPKTPTAALSHPAGEPDQTQSLQVVNGRIVIHLDSVQ